jgi:hypothetical protein
VAEGHVRGAEQASKAAVEAMNANTFRSGNIASVYRGSRRNAAPIQPRRKSGPRAPRIPASA